MIKPPQTMWLDNPLVGKSALLKQFEILGYPPGAEFWIKVDNNKPHQCIVTSDGFKTFPMQSSGEVDPKSGKQQWGRKSEQPIANGSEFMRHWSERGGEIFYIPNRTRGGICKGHVSELSQCFFETDDRTIAEQRQLIDEYAIRYGIVPSLVVTSGGKSLHPYLKLSESSTPDQWQRLQRKLIVLYRSDPQIQNLNREMRLAGFYRKSKGAEQSVLAYCDRVYAPDELETLLDSTGLFPHGLSEERWKKWRSAYWHSNEAKRDRELATRLLQIPEEELNPPRTPREPIPQHHRDTIRNTASNFASTGNGINLKDCLGRYYQELIVNGVSQGGAGRQPEGFKLACQAIAVSEFLNREMVVFSGDAYELLRDYAIRCSPPLGEYVIEHTWRQAQLYSGSTRIDEDAVLRRVSWKLRASTSLVEPSHPERDKTITREQWLTKHKLPQEFKAFSDWIREQFNRPAWKFWRQTGELPPNPKVHASKDPEKIREREEKLQKEKEVTAIAKYSRKNDGKLVYKFNGLMPTKDRWIAMGRPTIEYKPGQRLAVINAAIAAGWPFIQDQSTTGGGKSHVAGMATQEALGMDEGRIWYIAENYRNPTTESVERNFTPLPTRHDGMVSDDSQITPLGNPFMRRPVRGERTNIPGNCPETQTFREIESKAHIALGGKDSPICTRCPLFNGCEFLTERREAYQETRIRAHIDQLGRPKAEDVAFIDEPGKTIGYSKQTTIGLGELVDTCKEIESQNEYLYKLVKPIAKAIADKITETYSSNSSKFGFYHQEIMETLPTAAELQAIHWDMVADAFLEVDDIWVIPSLQEIKQQVSSLLSANLDQILEGGTTPELKQHLIKQNLFLNWISPLMSEILGDNKYSLRIVDQRLYMTASNNRHRNTIRGFRASIFLDATMEKSELAQVLRVSADDILPIRQELPAYGNLTVHRVKKFGHCGQQRGNESEFSQGQRIKYAVEAIKEKSKGDLGIIDFKAHTGNYEADKIGWWYNHNRGSNVFKEVDNLIGIGTPIQNLGQLAADYFALTGDRANNPNDLSGGFGTFVRRRSHSEIVQLVGRPRAHLRPNDDIHVWLMGAIDDECVEIIKDKFPGCTIVDVDAYDLTPKAAARGTQTERGIVEAMWSALQTGVKTTIDEVADVVEVSKGRVSQILKHLGGFKTVKKSLVFLFEALNRKPKLSELPSDALWVAQQFLPEIVKQLELGAVTPDEALEEFVGLAKAFGYKAFQAILAVTPAWVLTKIFGAILTLLPADCKDELSLIAATG